MVVAAKLHALTTKIGAPATYNKSVAIGGEPALRKLTLKGNDERLRRKSEIPTWTDLTLAPKMPPMANANIDRKTRQAVELAKRAYQYLARLMRPSKLNRNSLLVKLLAIAQPRDGR